MSFLRLSGSATCNQREHLEFISFLKNGFHPFEEFYGPPINHQPDVRKDRITSRFIKAGRQRVSPPADHQRKKILDRAPLGEGQFKFPLATDLFELHNGVDFDFDHSRTGSLGVCVSSKGLRKGCHSGPDFHRDKLQPESSVSEGLWMPRIEYGAGSSSP